MVHEVVWSATALEDVESMAEYIARDSEFCARAVVDTILETAKKLQDFPERGRIVLELGDEAIRERFVYSYRLISRVGDGMVTILAVIHGNRLIDPLSDRIRSS